MTFTGADLSVVLDGLSEGETFAILRRHAGVRQEDVAELAGLSRAYVSLYESGRTIPPGKTRDAFWAALNTLREESPPAVA